MEPLFEIDTEKKEKSYARFVISPLAEGYGNTLGVSLRRILLTSLPGAVATSVRLSGAKHQFSTIKGMREDVLDFLLNLKKVRFAYEGDKPVKANLKISNPGEVKAADIEVPAGVSISNPELVLANLSKGGKIEASITIECGVGYSPADDRKSETLGVIPLDASFSPIQRVNHKVEETRVGRVTNYDKLTLEIWTDGSIDPELALKNAAKILTTYLNQIVNPKKIEKEVETLDDDGIGPVGKLSVEEIGLPTRVANALSKAGYETVEKLVKADPNDLMKVRNLGDKSIKIINAALSEKGVVLNA